RRAAARLVEKDLAGLWDDLGSQDAARAYRAVGRLAAAPGRALPYLAVRARPAAGGIEERLARLIPDLDSDHFATRETATAELGKGGRYAVPLLEAALKGKPSLEMHRRIQRLLKQ